jgi:hypothetical protein
MLTKELLYEVKSMLERRWTASEIAHKLCQPKLVIELAIHRLAKP